MKKTTLLFLSVLLILVACQNSSTLDTSQTNLKFETQAAPEWDALFVRKSGWFGGDGIFAIPQNGVESPESADSTQNLILFSDTLVGEIEGDSLHDDWRMVNNSVAVMSGKRPREENIRFLIDMDQTGKYRSVFIPQLPDVKEGEYYWLGDGFVNPANRHTYIFAYRVVNNYDYETFQFDVLGGALISIPPGDAFPFKRQRHIDLPYFFQREERNTGSFGSGVFVNTQSAGAPDPDGYLYIYGVDDPGKKLLAARVYPADFEDLTAWRFWDGKEWNTDYQRSAPLTEGVSNELSLSPLPNGKYLLVFQVAGLSRKVGMRIGESPIGPFGETIEIWDCSEALEAPGFFPYNAKAHPSLSQPGELLISYNVNSFSFFDDIGDYPHLYRPRFFRLIFEE